MDKQESRYWNVIKGVAIFLMIWGHCIQYCAMGSVDFFGDPVFKTIYAFHMPLFMLVSGYLFSFSFGKRDLKSLLSHRIQGMLHPIVFATILSNILMLLPGYILSDHAQILHGALFEGIEYTFWFLWAVLISSVIVGTACKMVHGFAMRLVLTALGAFAVVLFEQWNMTLFMYPYFVAGFFAGSYREKAVWVYRKLRYPAFLLFPLLLVFYETRHYIYITPMYSAELGLLQSLKIALFRYVIGFVGSICVFALVEAVFNQQKHSPAAEKMLNGLAECGRNSLQIYCLSVPLLSGYLPHVYVKLMEPVGDNLFARNMLVYDLLFTPLLAAAAAFCIYGAVVLLQRTKVHKWIFGR